uniref:Neurotransmitter-gated ion-channel ligand-binding domain-containing protein n=1 Tax=Panagrolaimus sp. JU765 TaxID=591449 RepID=A0AC34PV21_9BILA
MCQSLMAGVIFAKLARPIKRAATILFSKNAVICLRDGKLCLQFRVGDMRKSLLAEAHVRLQMIKKCVTLEGEVLPFHQFDMNVGYDSGLDRVFVIWPITICHEINEESPLYEFSKESLKTARFEIIALLEGVVESVGSTTQARTSYLPNEIQWGKRFSRLVTYQRDDGQYKIDLAKFHDVREVDTPTCSAKELDELQSSCNSSLVLPPHLSVHLASKEGSEIDFEGARNVRQRRISLHQLDVGTENDSDANEHPVYNLSANYRKKASMLSTPDSEIRRKQSIQLLSLPTAAEVNDDFTTFDLNQNRLHLTLFNRQTYDGSRASHQPVSVGAYLFVDHIENLDELSQTLMFRGTLILTWLDQRLTWEPRDYGNINSTVVTSYLGAIWKPDVYFRTLIRATTKVLQAYNTELTVDYTGFVTAVSSISVMTECRLDYTNYPFENQTCAVMLVAPMSNALKMVFNESPLMVSRNTIFGDEENNMTSGTNFNLVGLKAERYFYFAGGLLKNQTKTAFTNTILRFELQLIRNSGHYLSMIALPLLATSVCAYVSACMSHSAVSLVWIAACLIMQVINYSRIVADLPPDYNVTPFCAKMTGLIFMETFVLFLYRFLMIIFYNRFVNEKDKVHLERLQQVEYFIAFVLILSSICNFWLLVP